MKATTPAGIESKRRSLFNRFLRFARTRLDLREPDLEICTGHSIFFDGD